MSSIDWPPEKTGGLDIVDRIVPNYTPDTGSPPTNQDKCGTCKFFVEGGSCALVKGQIDPVKGLCKFYENGQPLIWDTPVFPVYEKPAADYHEELYNPYLGEAVTECGCALQEGKKTDAIKGWLDKTFPTEYEEPKAGLIADTVKEGGVGSGRRKEYASQTRPDSAHVGWKNHGIDDYLDLAMDNYLAKKKMREAAVFLEEQHPRDPEGKFAPKGGGSVGSWENTDTDYRNFVDTTPLRGFSFDPASGKGFDFFNAEDVDNFYNKFSQNGQPVYVIGVTNQVGRYPDRQNQSEYERLKGQGNYPMIGYWRDDNSGLEYSDISFPASGIDDNMAIALGQKYAQASVVKLNPDGTMRLIHTGASQFTEAQQGMSSLAMQLLNMGYIQETWNEEDHPREPQGTSSGGEFASGEGGTPTKEPDDKLSQYQADSIHAISVRTPPERKKRIIDQLKREYALVYKSKYVGRDEPLTDQNYIDYHNTEAPLRLEYRHIDDSIRQNEGLLKSIRERAREVRNRLDALDPKGFYSVNIQQAEEQLKYNKTWLANEEIFSVAQYISKKYPEVWASADPRMWGEAIQLVEEKDRMSDSYSGHDEASLKSSIESMKAVQQEIDWKLMNHRMTSLEGHALFIEKDALHSEVVHQITAQIRAMKGKWQSEGGKSPVLTFEVHSGHSDNLFKLAGKTFRRSAAWLYEENKIMVYNANTTARAYMKAVTASMAHELGHAQFDNLIANDTTRDALGTFYTETQRIAQSKAHSVEFSDYFAKYATARRSAKVRKQGAAGWSRNLETEMFANLAEHQMDEGTGGNYSLSRAGGAYGIGMYDDDHKPIIKWEFLKRNYPKLIKAFETLRGMEGPQWSKS